MNSSDPITLECTINAPLFKVWQAITNKDQMKQWYFDLAEFTPEVGFEFQFEGGDECRTFLHRCKVVEVIPESKLAYTWQYDGYEGNSVVTFNLYPDGAKTRLKLMHEGLETFPANEPALAKANFVKGWDHIITTSLKEFLEPVTLLPA